MYLFDSLGAWDPIYYSVVQLERNGVSYKRAYSYDKYGQKYLEAPRDILSFGKNDIWLTSYMHWDGSEFKTKSFINPLFVENKMWGTSSTDFYTVGNNGEIAHYQNGAWYNITSNTTQEIHDIWGAPDKKTILCAVSSKYHGGEQKILKISGNQADTILWSTGRAAYSLWTDKGFPVFVCGEGIFTNKSNIWKEVPGFSVNYSNQIRGTGLNNIFVAGDFGLFLHYNGSTWKSYDDFNGKVMTFISIAVKGNMIVAVGGDGRKAYLVEGTLK